MTESLGCEFADIVDMVIARNNGWTTFPAMKEESSQYDRFENENKQKYQRLNEMQLDFDRKVLGIERATPITYDYSNLPPIKRQMLENRMRAYGLTVADLEGP